MSSTAILHPSNVRYTEDLTSGVARRDPLGFFRGGGPEPRIGTATPVTVTRKET